MLLIASFIPLSACIDNDPYVNKAAKFKGDTQYLFSDNGQSQFLKSGQIGSLIDRLNRQHKIIGAFLNKRSDRDKEKPSIKEIEALYIKIEQQIASVVKTATKNRFRINLPTISTRDLWDSGIRHHLLHGERKDRSTVVTYSGFLANSCYELINYLQSEFKADKSLSSLQGSYDRFLAQQTGEHKIVAYFDVEIGRYDFARQQFPVKSIFPADKYNSLTSEYKINGSDLIATGDDRHQCSRLGSNRSKGSVHVPAQLKVKQHLNLKGAAAALNRPISVPKAEAEKLVERYQAKSIIPRTVLAMAYFSPAAWQSSGHLIGGSVSVIGTAKLLQVEYYTYLERQKTSDVMFFNMSIGGRKSRRSGNFMANDVFKGVPLVSPIASVSIQ